MTVILNRHKNNQNNRERIWKVIRVLGEFSIEEVSILVNASHQIVSSYVFHLHNAGYVRQAGIRKEANGRKRLYRLIRNTGPKAPVPCRCIYDPNIDDATVSEPEAKDVA